VSPVQAVTAATPLARAQALAAGAESRAALRAALAGFDGCALRATATNMVFESGDPESGIVLIADVAGAAEDRAGIPFAGPAGAFLDGMLASIGLTRDAVFATSLLPWRPPGDRKPTDTEIQLCLPFLLRHLALLHPRFVLLMGSLSVRTLLPSAGRRAKGIWHKLEIVGVSEPVSALALGSPAHIQVTPSAKRDAWSGLLRLRRAMNNTG
jgi:DNA polymerase